MRRQYYDVEQIQLNVLLPDKLPTRKGFELNHVGRFNTYNEAQECLSEIPIYSYETEEKYVIIMTVIVYNDKGEEDDGIWQIKLIRYQNPRTKEEIVEFYDISGKKLDEYELDESFYSDKD